MVKYIFGPENTFYLAITDPFLYNILTQEIAHDLIRGDILNKEEIGQAPYESFRNVRFVNRTLPGHDPLCKSKKMKTCIKSVLNVPKPSFRTVQTNFLKRSLILQLPGVILWTYCLSMMYNQFRCLKKIVNKSALVTEWI